MLQALRAAQQKLSDYYSQTDNIPGDLYAISTMLAPSNKFKFFLTRDWDQTWRDRYRQSFKDFLVPYQERFANRLGSLMSETSTKTGSRLDIMLDGSENYLPTQYDELTQYLDSGTSHIMFIIISFY